MSSAGNDIKMRAAACLLAFVFSWWLFRADDTWHLSLVCLVVGLALTRSVARWSLVDCAVAAVWLYGLFLCLVKGGFTGGSFVMQSSCFVSYFLMRRLSQEDHGSSVFLRVISVPVAASLVVGLVSFAVFCNAVHLAGFSSLYDFRHLSRPLGYPVNVWASLCLALSGTFGVGWLVVGERWRWGFAALWSLASVSVLLSFSRGAFIAWSVYVVALAFAFKGVRRKVCFLSFCALLAGLVWMAFPKEMSTTLAMDGTISQRLSTESRVTATSAALQVAKDHQLLGTGLGTYSRTMDGILFQDSTRGYTSFAPNIVSQIIVEQGVVGLVLYALLSLAVLWTVFRRRNDVVALATGIALLAVVLKDMTMGVVLSIPPVCLSSSLLLALLQGKDAGGTMANRHYDWQKIVLVFLGCACIVMSWCTSVANRRNAEKNDKAVFLAANGSFNDAGALLGQLPDDLPFLVNKAAMGLVMPDQALTENFLQESVQDLAEAREKAPGEVFLGLMQAELLQHGGCQDEALALLNDLVEAHPRNAIYRYCLSKSLYSSEDTIQAVAQIVEAVMIMPRLIGMDYVAAVMDSAPSLVDSLYSRLRMVDTATALPDNLARCGYVAYSLGKRRIAKQYLSAALDRQPSYSTPWLLLAELYGELGDTAMAKSCHRKYCLLTKGVFADCGTGVLPQMQLETDEFELLYGEYTMKFRSWYGLKSILTAASTSESAGT